MRTVGKVVMALCLEPVAVIALVMGFWWLLAMTVVCAVAFLPNWGER